MSTNRQVINLIRTLDKMTDVQRNAVIERVIEDDPEWAERVFAQECVQSYDVYLAKYDNKIKAVKVIRDLKGWSLDDSKNFVEGTFATAPYNVPYLIDGDVSEETAEDIRKRCTEYNVPVHIVRHGERAATPPLPKI